MTHRSWWISKKLGVATDADVEELNAIVDERMLGKESCVHAYNGIGMQRALDGGCDSIDTDWK